MSMVKNAILIPESVHTDFGIFLWHNGKVAEITYFYCARVRLSISSVFHICVECVLGEILFIAAITNIFIFPYIFYNIYLK